MISCWVSTLPVYILLITTHQFTLAANTPENLIRVDTFLARVNLSDPKVFYVRNNLDGDVVFQESENASLLVYVSANDEEVERVKVEYNLVNEGSIVDIQVFIIPETTLNWPLIGGLASAGLFVLVMIVIVVMIIRKRKGQPQFEEKLELRNRGQVVAGKAAFFEKHDNDEVSSPDGKPATLCRRPKQLTPLIERKMANFESPHPKDETDSKVNHDCKKEDFLNGQQAKDRHGHSPNLPRPGNPRPQTSNFFSARAAFLVVTLITVALATSKAPTVKIVISVPASFVKNGSKIFFNEDFHGKLLLSEGFKPRKQNFQQFAVSQASKKVSSLDPCHGSCKFACDVQSRQCICLRGYKMKGESCHDVDECSGNKHNCHVQSTCSNTDGGFTCTCNDGYWGDGVKCYGCTTKPCQEGFYLSASCTRTRDRVCTACTPKCDGTTYQAYGCGLTFDRKCVDISRPLTLTRPSNNSNLHEVRTGSRLVVLKPTKNMVLLEDRLQLDSQNITFVLKGNSPNRTRLNRNSSFYVDLEIEQVNLVPTYTDYDAWKSNENLNFVYVRGFPEVFNNYCRYPAPNHYSLKHNLEKNRQTKVFPAKCFEHSLGLCPSNTAPGEVYYYRSINDACITAKDARICRKANQSECRLKEDPSKLYCTNYTKIVTDIFNTKESDFVDNPLDTFPTSFCSNAYRACLVCRDSCSNCDSNSNSQGSSSCSCCFKGCLRYCRNYYSRDCTPEPKQCAEGDTSQFTLSMNTSVNLNLQFNCYLELNPPETLYSLRYRVQHESERFISSWISKTLKTSQLDGYPYSNIQEGTHHLDSLEISHSTNFDTSPVIYLRGQRESLKTPYSYSVSSLGDDDDETLGKADADNTIHFQTKTPFSLTTRSWSNGETCQKLADWPRTLRKPYSNLKPAKVEHLGVQGKGESLYQIRDPHRPPSMTVRISDDESLFKYILRNASIRNDETFQSVLSRSNTSWNLKISGVLTSCPGFFTLQAIDEVDSVKVLEQDVVIICPEIHFKLEIHVPRKNSQDKERLFSVYLSDAKQKLKLQLAVVDQPSRKGKEPVKKIEDEKPDPWLTLMPLFVVTGCILLCLFAIMIYAQITHKSDEDVKDGPPGWKFVKTKDIKTVRTESSGKKTQPKDPNRLKRRHLILVLFFVSFRVVYSLIFTFSMAFAILTLLHGPNMKIIEEYQEFVQSKVDESNAIALQMDQHREKEAKRNLESSEDIQRSCDFYLGLQLQWLRYNMTCLIQENHLKMFNKLSQKIVRKVTEKIQALKKKIDQRVKAFQASTRGKLKDTKERLKNYGRRVYKNGWFALPKGAYKVKKAFGRKRRETAEGENYLKITQLLNKSEGSTGFRWRARNAFRVRVKRSIADSSFIGFLDFIGAVDQDKLVEYENNINAKLQYAKDGLADFNDVLKTGKSPEHPLSTILMCPLRYMLSSAKRQLKSGIQKLADEGDEWIKARTECFRGNTSDFFAANESTPESSVSETNSSFFSERISYEEVGGSDGFGNISGVNKSSLIESARGGAYYNIEKGDVMEEQVDKQKEELLEEEGKYKNLTKAYDADVFIVTKKAVLGVLVVIDILLLIYRGSKTYQMAFRLIQGFEETVRHDEDEFEEKPPAIKQRAERLFRRVVDFVVERFSKLLTFCKTLHKKIMRTNVLPMCIIIVTSGAVLYLIIAVVFNVMNVTVIEELGGYDLISSRLDTDYNFTNLAIADQVDFINNNEMRLYKESVNETLSEYKRMTVDFNQEQRERIEQFKRQMCSLENDTDACLKGMPELSASTLKFDPQTCIIPKLEGTPYEDYDGEAYRQRLKKESKRFVDAVRNIVLNTIYFIVSVVLSIILIAVLSYGVFVFLKSRGMVRVKEIHVYKSLPPEILQQFHLTSSEYKDEQDGTKTTDVGNAGPKKLQVPKIFLTESKENLRTRESEA